jgi:hypothetical protein
MKTGDKKKITLMIDLDVYNGLKQKVSSRSMGAFLSQIIRPHVVTNSLEASYLALAKADELSSESRDWESIDSEIKADNVWQL